MVKEKCFFCIMRCKMRLGYNIMQHQQNLFICSVFIATCTHEHEH